MPKSDLETKPRKINKPPLNNGSKQHFAVEADEDDIMITSHHHLISNHVLRRLSDPSAQTTDALGPFHRMGAVCLL